MVLASNPIVIMIVLALASSWGGGRKSGILMELSDGISGSIFLFFINDFSFSPISSSDDADVISATSKADSHYFSSNFSKTKVTILFSAVAGVEMDDSVWILKSLLCCLKIHTVFKDIFKLFALIPDKKRHDRQP